MKVLTTIDLLALPSLETPPTGHVGFGAKSDGLYQKIGTVETRLSVEGHTHTKSQITDFPTSMPASDVYAWAKATTKPSYTYTEVGAAAASHTHTSLYVPDTRAIVSVPENLQGRSLQLDFKNNTSVGNPPITASPTYSHIISFAGWNAAEGSGGWPSQMSIGDGIAVRQAVNATTWGTWRNVYHTGNLTSLSQLTDNIGVATHIADSTRHVTSTERNTWNAKSNLALGTTSTTAYRGDLGAIAYNHSQSAHAYLPLAGGTMANTNLVTNLNADLLDGEDSSFFKKRYNVIIKKGTWSRILYATPIALSGSFMVSINYTRNSTVVGNVFLITFGHSGHGQITVLGTHGYTQIQARLTGDANNIYLELFDEGYGTVGDTQTATITLDSINANITTYTSFTDGTTLSGSVKSLVSTVNNRINVDGRTVAFIDDDITGNAATATTLATARTIWGQSFNGSGNITGNLTLNGSLLSSAIIPVLNGGTAQGMNMGQLLVSSAYADVSKVPTNGIYSKGSIVSAGEVVAFGTGSAPSTDYDRLDSWASYDASKSGWVLSALLGQDLNARMPNIQVVTALPATPVAGIIYLIKE